MNIKNVLYNFLLVIFATIIALILVELFLRLNNQGPWGNLDNQRNDPTINKPHENLGWIPNQGTYYFEPFSDEGKGFTVNILEDGSRAVKHKNQNTSSDELIFLGGSITLGWGVNDEQTFASKLQKKINNYSIKNFSAGGYGTYQLFLRLEELLSQNKNIKTVVLIYVPNHATRNIGDEFWLRTLTKFSKRGYVGLPYASINENNELVRHKPIKYIRTPFMESIAISNKIAKRIMRSKLKGNDEKKFLVTNVIFSEIKKITEKNNKKLIIANISGDEEAFKPYSKTFKNSKIDHFSCIIKRTSDLVIKGDGHPNSLMHTMFSECMHDNLKNFIRLS